MDENETTTGRALRSTVTGDGEVILTIDEVEVRPPGRDQVVIRVEASPINPSDLGVLLAGADPTAAEPIEGGGLRLPLSPRAAAAAAGRVDRPMPVGNEGAGVVVAAGTSEAAQALVGRTVAVLAGGMYGTHRTVDADQCLVLAEGTDPMDAASCFVNPLTALGMTETMRLEGHPALVHTAAASNLGRMLNRICQAEGVELVNIVRRPEQAELLRSEGATRVADSSAPSFADDLTALLTEDRGDDRLRRHRRRRAGVHHPGLYGAGADRVGRRVQPLRLGHPQAGLHLRRARPQPHRPWTAPTAWPGRSAAGCCCRSWPGVGPERAAELRQRVADELTTTFASSYTATVGLDRVLDPATMAAYGRMATGEKVLVTPNS